jgi:glycosyltransferase involved in cell wall biosynthesis
VPRSELDGRLPARASASARTARTPPPRFGDDRRVARISGVLVTLNEAHNIRYALGSLASWCDELIVVDQHSEDGTSDIAREMGAHVFDHERTGIADPARVFAVAQSTGDWVMILDGDEMVPATLGRHLRQFVDGEPAADIVLIPFVNIHLGRWNRAGNQNWPSRKARFFRPGAVEVSGRIHASLTPRPDARKVPADATPEMAIWHFSYPSVEILMEKTDRYTTIQARQALEKGRRPSGHVKWFFGDALRYAWREYIRGRGYRDGTAGMIVTVSRIYYRFLVRAKMWDMLRTDARMRNRDRIRDRLLHEHEPGATEAPIRPPGAPRGRA